MANEINSLNYRIIVPHIQNIKGCVYKYIKTIYHSHKIEFKFDLCKHMLSFFQGSLRNDQHKHCELCYSREHINILFNCPCTKMRFIICYGAKTSRINFQYKIFNFKYFYLLSVKKCPSHRMTSSTVYALKIQQSIRVRN